MKILEFVQKIFKDFLIIFAFIIIMITFLRQMYYPHMTFDLKSIYIIMTFSFLSAFVGFILYAPYDLSEKKMRFRIAIHFFTLEILLITLSIVLGIVNSTFEGIILALQIAIIYVLVRLLSWQKDRKEAQKINEKLKALKNNH